MNRNNYICPRCNYKSCNKVDIRRHFNRIKVCPDHNDIILTDDIKEHVYQHHIYHKPTKPTTSTVINNFNLLSNLVNQLDLYEKLEYLLEYQDKKMVDFEDCLEQRFEHRVNRLESDKFNGGYLLDDLFGIINDATKIDKSKIENFNIIFDKVIKRFRVYRGKSWSTYLEENGAKEIISLIKSYYLDTYEIYLIRNIHTEKTIDINRIKLKDHLMTYYQFISVFDLIPSIQDQSDMDVLGHRIIEESQYYLGETYVKMYFDLKNKMKSYEKNKIQKRVINIIKENTLLNLMTLNQVILELLKVDESFRTELIKSRQLSNIDENNLQFESIIS